MKHSQRKTVEGVGLPSALEAEQGILAIMMICGADVSTGRPIVQGILDRMEPKHFYRAHNREVFQMEKEVFEAGYDVDPISILNHCGRERVEAVGGMSVFEDLLERFWMYPMWKTYCNQVLEKYRLRESILAADEITQRALSGEDSEEIATLISQTLTTIAKAEETKPTGIAELSRQRLVEIAEQQENPEKTELLTTGFIDIDRLVQGMGPGNLFYVGGYAKAGKTSFALSTVAANAKKGKRILIFSAELTSREVTDRILSQVSTVEISKITTANLNRDEWRALTNAQQEIAEWKIVISDTKRLTTKAIRAEALAQADKDGLDLIVVDYLQLITSTQKSENRRVEVDTMSRELKIIGAELKVPNLVLTQMNRASTDSQEPEVKHLREAGGQEADADVVLLLFKRDPEQNVVTVKVGANRKGPTGYADLAFLAQYAHMQNLWVERF